MLINAKAGIHMMAPLEIMLMRLKSARFDNVRVLSEQFR